ncbi:phosphatase PAP2 family protein [Salegentibacter sp. F188]|uniref:Phosphatase PAP2 family protein n=1 Tax=Autumnicola patrickiae TaxID=3075591 RepID=A0ABU3E321_9FLAO|nr:phosphatase PAP2 family protein [Salegentibacter sp. F188]MDT0690401.1 phosphatase PAP2 family protein [Salegentibacter sp. F188]
MKKNKFLQPAFQLEVLCIQLRHYFLISCFFVFFLSPTESHGQFFNPEDSFIENAGDGTLFLIPVSAITTSLILEDYRGTWQFTKSFALNLAVTGAAKVLINKERPLQGGDYAFPSGHTSVAFQGASFFHRRYGFKYSIPAYVLAGYTGFSRIHATRHDGWDVLAGAVVGIGSTWFFTNPREKENMELTFSSSDDHYLLGFRYVF